MKTNFNLWTITFIVSFSFLVAAFLIFWVSLRRFLRKKNFRPLCLGLGFIIVAITNLLVFLSYPFIITEGLMLCYLLGFELILVSLIVKKWQYFLLIGAVFPLFLPTSSNLVFSYLIVVLPVPYLAYFNFCKASSACEFCAMAEKKDKEGREWAFIFLALILSISLFSFQGSQSALASKETIYFAAILMEFTVVVGIYYHILKCVSFSKGERVLLPLMTSFVVVLTLVGYLTITLVSTYMEKFIMSSSLEEVNAVKEIVLLSYPEDKLLEKIKAKDENLDDLLDNIYAKTGLRSAIFLGNERVAATLSATGKGRMLGTRIEDAKVNKNVLKNGYDYTGKIEKGGELVIAAYTPIYDGDQIVGMVGTGKTLSFLYELHYKILLRTVAGVAMVMIIVFSVTYYTIPRRM